MHSYSITNPPDLTYTIIQEGRFLNKDFQRVQWTKLLYVAINEIRRVYPNEFKEYIRHNCCYDGIPDNGGYHFIEEVGFSMQGFDTKTSFKTIQNIVLKLRCPFKVKFQWRNKEGALHPGEYGIIQY